VPVHPGPAAVKQDRPAGPVAAGAVEGAADRGRERDEDGLVALADDAQDAVAVFLAEVGDVRSDGFEDPQSERSVAPVEPGDEVGGRLAEEAVRVRRPRAVRACVDRSAFAGFRFPPEVITLAVRWYLRYGLSYRDLEELLAERGVEVDHVTVYRWVQRFTPLFADAARPLRHATGDRWFVDETYVKVSGRWRYLYRAVDQFGQVIDVLLSGQRDAAAARRFFTRALRYGPAPVEVSTDKAGPYLRVLADLVPAAAHVTEQFSNNRIEADHGRLKARLRPMRGLKRFRSAARIAAGHAFVQNLRRGHYELATEVSPQLRVTTAFTELALAI
jgi:transposase-like protein